MPDNWGFVLAAYGLTALVLGLYWRHLVRREKELQRATAAGSKTADSARHEAGHIGTHTEHARQTSGSDREITERSRPPSRSGHPRPDPTSRGPRQP